MTNLRAIALIVGLMTVAPADAGASEVRAQAAPPAEAHVDVREEYFYPSTVTVRRGGTVVWDWTGQATHNVVDQTGMGLYSSGLVPPGGPSFAVVFDASGSYPYVCTLHAGMEGHVEVPIRVTRSGSGAVVTWSSRRAPEGFVFDVQVRRDHRWETWLDATAERRGTYDAASGRLKFRARLRLDGGVASTGWSEPASIDLG